MKKAFKAANIFFFSGAGDESKEKINKIFNMIFSNENNIMFHGDEVNAGAVGQSKDPSLSILLPSSKDELQKIISRKHLFCNMRLILVLPDEDDETLNMAHSLNPWHLIYPDTDYISISAALLKMRARLETAWQIAM